MSLLNADTDYMQAADTPAIDTSAAGTRLADTIEDVRLKLRQAAYRKVPQAETVKFFDSLGRTLAQPIEAADNVPGFRRSVMDGYAVAADDIQGASANCPVVLNVIEKVEMGKAPRRSIASGQAAYVPTGGMVPDGADAVVMVEFCEKSGDDHIAIHTAALPGENIIMEGEAAACGQTVLEKGCRIRPQDIGTMAAVGAACVEVFKPWRLTVISTGDELTDAAHKPEKGRTRDVNTYLVTAAAEKHGFETVNKYVLKDDPKLLKETIEKSLDGSDVVVVSGGSSKGERDHTARVMNEVSNGGVFTHGIALKPGGSSILSYDSRSETIMIGLPGHPAAAMLVFELMIVWLYRQLTGQKSPVSTAARLTEAVEKPEGATVCLPVSLRKGMDCIYAAEPLTGSSRLITGLTEADGYVMIGTDDEPPRKGQLVEVVLF